MASTIRATLVQTSWTGDKETMIKAHEEYAREAASSFWRLDPAAEPAGGIGDVFLRHHI